MGDKCRWKAVAFIADGSSGNLKITEVAVDVPECFPNLRNPPFRLIFHRSLHIIALLSHDLRLEIVAGTDTVLAKNVRLQPVEN